MVHSPDAPGIPATLSADLPLAEYLVALGHWPQLVPIGGGFFAFHFPRTPEVERAAAAFGGGEARVEPRILRVAQARLRRVMREAGRGVQGGAR